MKIYQNHLNRTHKTSLFLLSLTVIMIIVSCSKDDSNPKIENPEDLGKTWTYIDYNCDSSNIDTIKIIQFGETQLNNGLPVSKLIYKYPSQVDTNFIYISEDTIIEFENRNYNSKLFAYIFPLTVGKYWTGFNSYYDYDSTIVIEEINIEVFPNEWYNGFKIYRKASIDYDGFEEINWYVPEIGLIKCSPLNEFDNICTKRKLIGINFTPANSGSKKMRGEVVFEHFYYF